MNNIFIFEYLSNMKGKRKEKCIQREKRASPTSSLLPFFLPKTCGDKIVIEMNPN